MSKLWFKVLGSDGQSIHGGTHQWSLPTQGADGAWTPGDWHELPSTTRVMCCVSGFHLTEDPVRGRWFVPGNRVFVAEYEGVASTQENDKIAVRKVRLVRELVGAELAIAHIATDGAHTARGTESWIALGSSSVEAWGSSSVVAWESSSVVARESSRVEAWGSSSVEAWGSSSVVAWESSSVVARGSSSVVARESSRVEAWGSSSVEAWESSSVVARESSSVVARESSRVVARESSSVVAWGSSSVVARESSRVVAWGSSRVVARESSRVELPRYSRAQVSAREQSTVLQFSTEAKARVREMALRIDRTQPTPKVYRARRKAAA